MTKVPLTQQPLVIGLTLLFCFPVGLILAWKHPHWTRRTKIGVTWVVGLIAVLGLLYNESPAGKAEQARQQQQEAAQAQRDAQAVTPLPATASSGPAQGPYPPQRPYHETRPNLVGQVALQKVRVVPFTTAQGKAAQVVLVDWQNTGRQPIREVWADIVVRDAEGQETSESTKDQCVFAVFGDSEAVKPGRTFHESRDKGYIVGFDGPGAVSASARLTRAYAQDHP